MTCIFISPKVDTFSYEAEHVQATSLISVVNKLSVAKKNISH